jgi:hypothetical protein
MVPLRVTATIIGSRKVQSQWDLEYSNGEAGSVLRSWKYVSSDEDGHIRYANTAKVLQWTVNPDIDDSNFDIQFPIGTYIEDKVTGEKYILKENSRKRHVTAKDWATAGSYETLLQTEPTN